MLTFQLESVLKFVGRLLLAGVQILAAFVLLWLVLHEIYPGDRWFSVRMISYFAPWLFMALIPGLIIVLFLRRRWLARLIMGLLVLFATMYWPVLTPQEPQAYAQSDSNELRVMTFNVNFNNRNNEGIGELIATESPDVIAFQEMTDELFDSLRPKLETTHPYYLVDKSWALPMVLVSRYPLTSQPKPVAAVRAQHASAEMPSGTVMIWNVHPAPVVGSGWESQKGLLALVAEDVAAEDKPVIVLGDFNTTSQTENYDIIAARLTDVHWAAGQGFGFTWPDLSRADTPDRPWYVRPLLKFGPVIDIDHIFASEHFIPQQSYVVSNAHHSDHRPMVADLWLLK